MNPKDLSNEELEYVIRTGKMPPKFNSQTDSYSEEPAVENAPFISGGPTQSYLSHKSSFIGQESKSASTAIAALQSKVDQLSQNQNQLTKDRDALYNQTKRMEKEIHLFKEKSDVSPNKVLIEQLEILKNQNRTL